MLHCPEAEEGAIGCCLLEPSRIDELNQAIGPDSIVDIRVKLILETITRMWEEDEPIDIITLVSRLRLDGNVDQVGGITYINQCCDCVPSTANLPYYIKVIKDAESSRDTTDTLKEGIQKIQEGDATASEVFEDVESRVANLKEKHSSSNKPTAKDIILSLIDSIEAAHQGHSKVIPTGFSELDRFLSGGGLAPKEFSVIAARPSHGKSVMAKDIALSIARRTIPVGVFSLEDSAEGFMLRLLSGWSKIPASTLKSGKGLTDDHFDRMTRFNARISDLPLHIDDESPLAVNVMVARMAEMSRKQGVRIFIIDYLQYVSPPETKPTRTQEVSVIAKTLKSAAKRLGVHVLALAQLSRTAEDVKDGVAPSMHHLGESASIEQEADIIMMIHNDADKNPNLHIAKQRNGPKFIDIPLILHKETVTFTERKTDW